MDLVFEGSLSKAWGIKDALGAVLTVPDLPYGVLRLSSPNKNIQGKVLISNGSHIVGAQANFCDDAYEALRGLLSLEQGNFAFLDLSDESIDFDQSLFISIEVVLRALPALPESASSLFDQGSLLDRVFGNQDPEQVLPSKDDPQTALLKGSGVFPANEITLHGRGPIQTKSAPEPVVPEAPITKWNIVEPFQGLSGGSKLSSGSMLPDFVQTPDEQRTSMLKLKAVSANEAGWQSLVKNPQQPIRWILSALGFSLLICLLMPTGPERLSSGSSQLCGGKQA